MKTLQLHNHQTLFHNSRGEVLSQQGLKSFGHQNTHSAVRQSGTTFERIAELRRQIAAGEYLGQDTEQRTSVVVEGILRDLMTDARPTRSGRRAAV